MFTLDRLRALDALAVHGSMAGAARALHITPSGVSQQLAKLERESGHRLLEPDGRGVRLTHAGRVLAGHAARVVAQVATAEADLSELRAEILGPLRLGGVGSSLRALLPSALATLTETYPRLAPTVVDGEAVDMVPMLVRGELDVVLAESWESRPTPLPAGLGVRTLVVEEVRVALSEAHPLAGRAEVDLAELDGSVWAACPEGTDPYEALVQALRGRGVEPEVRYTVIEYATQLALVARNLAVALVPEMAQRPCPEGVRFVPGSPALRREVLVVWRAHAWSPSVRALVSALSDLVERRRDGWGGGDGRVA
ncbi:LysR family transcriptional regulator [Streptomyces sp. AJS327]|uniref:LysR family transcriptional regulator n=1 Tax=Streptomyces sp. AJS327 TaxID=2545265 RepID=UPI0015E04BA4|nr:LysR family transcriptional regulator [Streptomyces sp. AJS327]MBA0049813.1 LysR family transcriptional regulator [Streptomyces sp. AJS327]